TWTGEVCAEAAQRLLNGQLKRAGFQSAARAFGHRELLEAFHPDDFCNLPD
ncbi:MAG: saccharopine dehydrogenase, partial [Xanthomonadales bacterium]|nr:saccharopine dehydrogenase [Xanthomonadales bacterium]